MSDKYADKCELCLKKVEYCKCSKKDLEEHYKDIHY
jgi:hypothetical protein